MTFIATQIEEEGAFALGGGRRGSLVPFWGERLLPERQGAGFVGCVPPTSIACVPCHFASLLLRTDYAH